MNRFTKSLLQFTLAAVLTVATAGIAAAVGCADYIIGSTSSGSTSFDCDLTGSGGRILLL